MVFVPLASPPALTTATSGDDRNPRRSEMKPTAIN